MFWLSGLHSEFQFRRLPAGHLQGSETPIPNRQAAAEILVEMNGVAGVMKLMMRGPHQQATPRTGGENKKVRVLKVDREKKEAEKNQIGPANGKHLQRLAQQVVQRSSRAPEEQSQKIVVDDSIDRMHAIDGERRKHFRGVVHLMEFPKERYSVAQIMGRPIAELVSDKHADGADNLDPEIAEPGLGQTPEKMSQPRSRGRADVARGKDGPSEQCRP